MPYKANEPRRHKIPRARDKVANGPEYDRALQQRGRVTAWVTPEALAAWQPPRTGQRGRPCDHSDLAIETGHLRHPAFGRPWRQPDPPVAIIIPPRSTAVPSAAASTTPSQRDQHIQMIGDKGRIGWKAVGYGRRAHAETAMFRYKALIGSSLRARTLPTQETETKAACSVLNRMAKLGMPAFQRVR